MIKTLRFSGVDGDRLAAQLDAPQRPRAYALFAHCFTCSKDLRSVRRLSRALVEHGIAVLRFDFTGLGESEGDFADTNFSSNVQDLISAADYLRSEHTAPKILIGHSLGGAAVLAAAAEIPEAVAVATLGAPSDVAHLQTSVLAEVDPDAEVSEVSIAGRPFLIRRQLLDDLAQHRLLESVATLRRALLVLHSPVDEIVSIDNARRIYDAAKHPKSFVSLDGADHLLMKDPADARFAAAMLASWAERYLPGTEDEAKGSREVEPAVPDGEVMVSGGASGYRQTVKTPAHTFAADEPESLGGTDSGPNPYELLLAALGSCMSMTLRMYADRKGWPLAATEVRLRHFKIHARDCKDCETEDGRVDVIEKRLQIEGDLDDHQRQRLVEISERCPVHRTLTSEVKIRWAEDERGLGQASR